MYRFLNFNINTGSINSCGTLYYTVPLPPQFHVQRNMQEVFIGASYKKDMDFSLFFMFRMINYDMCHTHLIITAKFYYKYCTVATGLFVHKQCSIYLCNHSQFCPVWVFNINLSFWPIFYAYLLPPEDFSLEQLSIDFQFPNYFCLGTLLCIP